MARDWDAEAETMKALDERLMRLAPDNTAEFPISCVQQRDQNGNLGWVVDIHVRIPRVTEYEVTAFHPTYAGAIRRAYLGLNNETKIRQQSHASNKTFGVTV